jgi:spermidine synthase
MKPWEVLGRSRAPDGAELTLTRHPSEYLILADGQCLMSSRSHGSEDALAVFGCDRARALPRPCVLIGGLGMGFTLRAALDLLPPAADVLVAELVPAVIEWNRGPLGPLAHHPLDDFRVRVEPCDVAAAMRLNPGRFDAVLLDVDNGPAALTASSNATLYDGPGIAVARRALRADGVLAIWSANANHHFERRLRTAGFRVERQRVSGRPTHQHGGLRHTVVVAHRRPHTAPART